MWTWSTPWQLFCFEIDLSTCCVQDMDNWTFDDFMEKSYDVKNVIERAIFNDQSNDRIKL